MFEKNPVLQRGRSLRGVKWFAILLLAGMMPSAGGQATQTTAPAAPAYSEADKAFAAELSALPLEEALQAVSKADASRLTAGVCRAFRENADQASVKNPHRAVEISKVSEAVAMRAGLPVIAADTRYDQAYYMQHGGETYEAITVFGQALAMFKAAGAPGRKIGIVYQSRAIANLRLGDLDAAISDDKEALRIFREDGDEVSVARAENGLGNAFREQGSFSEAEDAFREALRIARAHDQRIGEAFVLNNLSMLHSIEGDYPMAIQFGEQSLAIKRQIGDKAVVATTLINLSNYYDVLDRDVDAMRVLGEAAQIGRDLNLKESTAKAIAQMGIIQLKLHHNEEALKLLDEGARLGAAAEDRQGHAYTLYKVAEAYLNLKNYDKARAFSQEAASIARRGGMLDELAGADQMQGQVYLAQGKLKEARGALEESIGAIEQMRNHVSGGAETRQRFMAERTNPYRLLTAVAARQEDWAAALDSSEKGKGRILLDLYTGNELSSNFTLTDAERVEESRLRSRFLSLDMQFDQQASRPGFDPAQKNELDANLHQAKTDLEDFREQLYGRHPELRLRRADFSALTAKDMQTLVPDRATALLEYELTASGNYLFVVTRGDGDSAKIHGYKLAVTLAELTRHVRHFREQLASRDPEFAAESRWLYAALLEPARAQLGKKSLLVVVPDGVLWQIPFQAFERPDGRFLIESAAIDYVPSLAVLRALKSSRPKLLGARSLLAMGDPGGHTQEQRDEVQALTRLYGAKNARTLIGKAATLDQFLQSAARFDVVHIAAHGIYNDREPMASHMLLASANGQAKAGWLRARDIQAMQLQAELVVLSGCETGKGAFEDGEGLLGMSWATLAAGAHSSLASAWRVEASSTTEMMVAFHQDMLRGVGKAEALRRSELKVLHSDKYAHPFYWAAFVLMGDGAP